MPPTYPTGLQVCVVVPQERTQASDILVTMTPAVACLQFLAAAVGAVLGRSEFLTISRSRRPLPGHLLLFICKVSGGEVEARLRWLAPDGEEVTLGGSPFSAEPIDEASVGLRMILSEPAQGGTLKCIAETGDDREEIQLRAIGRVTVHGETLIIRELEPSDAGVYTCEASIAERTESAEEIAKLRVTFRPRLEGPKGNAMWTRRGRLTILTVWGARGAAPGAQPLWSGSSLQEIHQGAPHTRTFQFTPKEKTDFTPLKFLVSNPFGTSELEIRVLGSTRDSQALSFESPSTVLGLGAISGLALALLLILALGEDALCCYSRRVGLFARASHCFKIEQDENGEAG